MNASAMSAFVRNAFVKSGRVRNAYEVRYGPHSNAPKHSPVRVSASASSRGGQ
jgi:hypothetical protein